MPQFDISTFSSQLFWLAIVFTLLYLIIGKLVVPRAENVIANRYEHIEGGIRQTEEITQRISQLTLQKDRRLLEINQRIEYMKREALGHVEAQFAEQKRILALELQKKSEVAVEQIAQFAADFRGSQQDARVDLAAFIIERITQQPADLQLLNKLVKESQ